MKHENPELCSLENSDYTPPREFCAKTALESDNISDEKGYTKEGGSFGYYVWEYNIKQLGCDAALLLSMIEGLSNKYGYCFMKNETFACRLGVSVKSIERWLKFLEDKHLIYRNTWNTPKGRVRHIVGKDLYMEYWESFLMRKGVPHEARKNFLNFVFKGNVPEYWPNPPDPPKNPKPKPQKKDDKFEGNQPHQEPSIKEKTMSKTGHATLTPEGVHATLKPEVSLLLRNSSIKHKERTTEGAGPQNVVVDAFEKKVVAELASVNITGPRTEIAIQYYRQNKAMVDSKANPIGWIIRGVQNGWISDMVQKQKEQRVPEIKEAMNVGKLAYIAAFLTSQVGHIDNDEISFKVDPAFVNVHFKKKNRSCQLELRDKATLEKVYNCLGNYKLWDELQSFVSNFPADLEDLFNPHERERHQRAV